MGDGSGNSADLRALIVPFYTEFMTAHPQSDADEILERMGRLISDDLGSASNVDGEPTGKQKLLATGRVFIKLMPDFKMEPQEILRDGDKVIVRTIASGTPTGSLKGIECDGSRWFQMTTIEIITFKNDQIVDMRHADDWFMAMKQLLD